MIEDRNKIAAWMMAQGYATGHGDTVEDLLNELEWQVEEREREACAKVCEEWLHGQWHNQGVIAAMMIRERGQT